MRFRIFAIGVLLLGTSLPALSSASDDSIGPVAGWRGHTRVDDDGVQATTGVAPPANGRAWTPQWFTAKDAGPATTVFLRRALVVPDGSSLKQAVANVSADRAYRLWINGRLVSRGPDDPGSDVGLPPRWTHQWLYNTVDLTPYLHAGSNEVSVEIVNSSLLTVYSTGRTGFAFAATLTQEDGRTQTIEGPKGWVGIANGAYGERAFDEAPDTGGLRYDASLEPAGWPLPSDAAAWPPVVPVASSWGTLLPSRIPARMEAVWPAVSLRGADSASTRSGGLDKVAEDITVTGDTTFTVGYGRVVSAYLAMQVASEGGAVVTLLPRETRDQKEVARPIEVRLRDGVTTWESPSYDSFSEVEVRVTHVTRPVRIAFLRAIFTSQPVVYRGSFDSSDDHLNALWRAARWQTQICLQDRYLDSPNHQEPIGDPGDYLIASLQSDYAFGDPWMAAQNLRQFAALLDRNGEVTFHASYPLFWVQMLLRYYERTGDKALVEELAPSVDRLLAHLGTYKGANGLLSEAPNYMFMDWIKVEGFNLHHPPAVIGQGYFTALYYQGLKDGATIAALAGDSTREHRYEKEAATLAQAFEKELWDAKAGLYRDGKPHQNHQPIAHYFPADRDIETHTDQVNILAVLHGLASPERGRSIMDTLLARPRLDVQPYFMSFAFDAEARTGSWDRVAWSQMQQWHLNPATGTFREMWTAGDWSHSWGGSPLVQLSSRVLGVTPASPGYASVAIAPHLIGLEWANGVVPTPRGDVSVAWKRTPDGLELTFSSPKTVPIRFDPMAFAAAGATLTIDGDERHVDAGQVFTLVPGAHVVTVSSAAMRSP